MIRAGATPKLMASTRESSSAPNRVPVWVTRATRPSRRSRALAITTSHAAVLYCPRAADTTAHTPKKRFPSVSALGRMITPRWSRVLTFGLRCLARRERGAAWGSSRTDPAFRRWGCTPRAPNREFVQVVPRQALKYSQVALRRRVDDLLRQRRRRWLAVPASLGDEGIEVVPNRLLVQRRLRPAGDVALPRPESGRVRGQHLVDQEE